MMSIQDWRIGLKNILSLSLGISGRQKRLLIKNAQYIMTLVDKQDNSIIKFIRKDRRMQIGNVQNAIFLQKRGRDIKKST